MKQKVFLSLFIALISCHTIVTGQAVNKNSKKVLPNTSQTKLTKNTVLIADTLQHPETRVKITTSLGIIIVRLSNKTPLHRDNFIKLVQAHFYDSLLFHRVIAGFMIQGGDLASKNAKAGSFLGEGGVGYTIPAEFDSTLYHKKGALAAARDDNPQKASSGCQFYIVEGKKLNDQALDMAEQKIGSKLSPAKRMTYKMNGGTPLLDTRYTVFGEVESGIEVVDKIALEPVDNNNRPLINITMKMEVLKEEIK